MFEKIKAWLPGHRKGVLVTATIVAVTGTVAILLINGSIVKMPIKELAKRLVPEYRKFKPFKRAIKILRKLIKRAAPDAETADETVTVEVDGIRKAFNKSEFLKHLREGWHAAKAARAADMGIELKPGEAITNSCNVKIRAS